MYLQDQESIFIDQEDLLLEESSPDETEVEYEIDMPGMEFEIDLSFFVIVAMVVFAIIYARGKTTGK